MSPQRDRFAMIPESLITGLLPAADSRVRASALHLYAYLDLRQGKDGRPVRGFRYVARAIGLQERTVAKVAKALAEAGVIELTLSEGSKSAEMRVVHNPARERFGHGVDVGQPPSRYRHDPIIWSDEITETLSRQTHSDVASGAPQQSDTVALDATPPRSTRSALSEGSIALLLPMLDSGTRCDDCLCLTDHSQTRLIDPTETFCGCPFEKAS